MQKVKDTSYTKPSNACTMYDDSIHSSSAKVSRLRVPKLALVFASLIMLISGQAYASSTSGIHGPGVDPTDRSVQVRLGFSPADTSSGQDFWAYRLHYQHSLNDKFRVRVVTQFRDRGRFEYDFARTEFLYQFVKANQSIWSSGIRLDVRTRRGSRAEDMTVHWTNQWDLSDNWQARGIILAGTQIGSNKTSSGTTLGTRFGLSKKLEQVRVGVELYNNLGRVGDFGSFNDQDHQFGPFVSGKIAGMTVSFRYLAGLSDGSRDHDFGLRFDRKF